MTRRTKHLKWVGATVVTAIALAAQPPAEAGSGTKSSPATAVYGAVRDDQVQERSDATGRGGLDRGDAALAVALLAGVFVIGRWGDVVVGALIAVVASLAGVAARLATGKPRPAPGWADWPGTDAPSAPKQRARRRPWVRRAETELR